MTERLHEFANVVAECKKELENSAFTPTMGYIHPDLGLEVRAEQPIVLASDSGIIRVHGINFQMNDGLPESLVVVMDTTCVDYYPSAIEFGTVSEDNSDQNE